MYTLAPNLRYKGFDYECIASGEKAFIYLQRYSNFDGIEINYYEVFKKVIRPECVLGGNIIPEHVAFPGHESFGIWAWSYRDENKARAKFAELESRVKINAVAS